MINSNCPYDKIIEFGHVFALILSWAPPGVYNLLLPLLTWFPCNTHPLGLTGPSQKSVHAPLPESLDDEIEVKEMKCYVLVQLDLPFFPDHVTLKTVFGMMSAKSEHFSTIKFMERLFEEFFAV